MKKLFYLIAFAFPLIVSAQTGMVDFDAMEAEKPINAGIIGKSVLIIPFSTDMYNNQESRYIVEKSGMHYNQSVNYFKASLDSALIHSLDDSCKVISMLTNFTQSTSSDLERIHGAAKYKMIDRPTPVESKKKNNLFADKFNTKNNRKSNNNASTSGGIRNGEIVSSREDLSKKFMSVGFEDQDFINAMTIKYGAKYILFITQFEILGDYSDPYAVAQKSYDRIIKTHYCIFENSGKFIGGDYLEQRFSAKDDNIVSICNSNFPALAEKVVRKLP